VRTRNEARRRRGLACAIGIALLAVPAGGARAATSAAPSSTGTCARAFALYEAKYYADAEQAYKKLLGVDSCARARDVAIVQRAAAPTAAELIARAKRARDAGFEADARTLVQQLVKDHPHTPIPPDLRTPDQRLGFWEGILGAVVPWLRFVAEALVALLAAAALALGLVAIARSLRSRFRRSLVVAPFVGAHADPAGPSITSALHEHIGRLRNPRASRSLYFADSGESDFGQLPEAISSAFPQVGVIAALVTLVSRLGPRRLWRVTGTLLPIDPVRGAGLTLVVVREHAQTVEQITLWESDYHLVPDGGTAATSAGEDELASRFQRLALPAAVWLAYRPTLGTLSDPPPMGTADWQSYATFAVGEEQQTCGNERLARRLYCEALDLDPGNLGARTNLAALLLAPVPGELPEQRIEREQLLAEQIARVTQDPTMRMATTDPLWYRIHYLQAISRLYADQFTAAGDSSRMLVTEIREQLSRDPGSLRPLLERLWFPARILRENVAVEAARCIAEVVAIKEPRPKGDWIGAAGHYNLACHFARKLRRLVDANAPTEQQAAYRRKALSHLRIALFYGDAGGKPSARTDPALAVLHGDAQFDALVPDPSAAPQASANGGAHTTVLHGTLISMQAAGDGSDDGDAVPGAS
jgi:tetratricopeptide (TPR) repeat protein